jgi:cyclophilin family peptidyl-prolyl cis-trans isomerase
VLKIALLCLSLVVPMGAIAEEASEISPAAVTTKASPAPVANKTKPAPVAKKTNPQLVLKTSEGDLTVVLFADKAPLTVENFLSYVDSGFYNGTIFHRVIPNFMIQAGGFTPDMQEKDTQDTVANESKNRLHNTRGTLAMARTSNPDSASSQFFINQRSNLQLDWAPGRPGYTVFGEVVLGMNVVDFIATAPTGKSGRFGDVPKKPILIKEIVRKKSK